MLQFISILLNDYKPEFIGRDVSCRYKEIHGAFKKKSLF